MDDVVAWFEETLRLRFEALHASMAEPDHSKYLVALGAYGARVAPGAVDHGFANRDEDATADDLEFFEDAVADLVQPPLFAALDHGDDRFTMISTAESDFGQGRVPVKDFYVSKVDGAWRVVGQSSRRGADVTHVRGVDYSRLPVRGAKYFNEGQLHPTASSFPGSIKVG